MHESHFAFALERTGRIQALPVVAQCRIVRAFVYIDATVAVPFEAGVASAFEGTIGVDALSVLIAAAVIR